MNTTNKVSNRRLYLIPFDFLTLAMENGSSVGAVLISILVRTYSVQSALAGRQQPPTAPASPCGGEGVGGGPR
uniref:Uncharacterized protein n=1 Tax=Rhodococcus hoagii TaxID=43767 RepID=A0A1Z1UWV0_RHOHA|nr:hypothetical protein pVAPN1557_00078 [Prescottella equi]